MKTEVKIFSGSASGDLTAKIAASYGTELGKVSIERFSDGEFVPQFMESLRGHDVFIVQSTFPPADNLKELLLLIDAAKRASAQHITAVIPYYGDGRGDRKDKPRVPIAAKVNAQMIEKAGAHRVITMDLHAEQIQGFFDIPIDHLYASAVFVPYIQELNLPDLAFSCVDAGGVARARKYAEYFNADLIICLKFRAKANVVEKIVVVGDPTGKNILIPDDIVDTGGSLAKVADELMARGAKSVRGLITHPVLSGKAYETIENSPLVELVTTDTIPLKQQSSKIKVLSVSELFATAIDRIYNNDSVTKLFVFNH
ncbi:MAG TPA: ribose-phosphate pyrophosphokinase [Candidatus Paceibacterota bacterium]|jgi:ribose-phosphate pyrophosphokinase|nr:ribose-phosphate pyrophosphokinase [Candidatus Paceibacterota bacterium]